MVYTTFLISLIWNKKKKLKEMKKKKRLLFYSFFFSFFFDSHFLLFLLTLYLQRDWKIDWGQFVNCPVNFQGAKQGSQKPFGAAMKEWANFCFFEKIFLFFDFLCYFFLPFLFGSLFSFLFFFFTFSFLSGISSKTTNKWFSNWSLSIKLITCASVWEFWKPTICTCALTGKG